MAKNIVICCDGTANEFKEDISNVVKLHWILKRESKVQVAFYQPGVGTAGEVDWIPFWGRITKGFKWILGLAFGYGVLSNLANCYRFLMDNYEPGDKVFVFGFSRGAYTARALCAFIHMFGIFDPGNYILVEYAIEIFKRKSTSKFKLAAGFKDTFGRECRPHFVGVWDTVSSVGWIYNPLSLPYTHKNPDINIGRHALAIDERRSFFRQNSWKASYPGQDLKEVWFPGVHCDVGGGYPEKESGLSKIPFKWMVDEALKVGLLIDEALYRDLLGGMAEYSRPESNANMHESLTGGWKIAEIVPRRVWHPVEKKMKFVIPYFGYRFVPEDATLHESVIERMALKENNYKPKNLSENKSS